MKKQILLWLDDQRNPFLPNEKEFDGLREFEIHWVRSYKEFESWCILNDRPTIISFDHDLAPEHYTPEFFWDDYELSKKYQESVKNGYEHGTGVECAEFAMKYYGDDMPNYRIHSANPVGADWIREVLPNQREIRL